MISCHTQRVGSPLLGDQNKENRRQYETLTPKESHAIGDRVVAQAMPKPDPEIPNHWGVYFAVDDTAKAIETAETHDGHVTYGPLDIPDVGAFAGLADPYRANFTVIQMAQPVE